MITLRDRKYFNVAAQVAELSTYKRNKVGCVVVYKNSIISTGFNKDRTDPLQKKYNVARDIPDWSPHKMHAEIDAIKSIIHLDINWNKVSIYVYRKRKDRAFGISRPCPSCMKLIKDMGIHYIYYTTDDGYAMEVIN